MRETRACTGESMCDIQYRVYETFRAREQSLSEEPAQSRPPPRSYGPTTSADRYRVFREERKKEEIGRFLARQAELGVRIRSVLPTSRSSPEILCSAGRNRARERPHSVPLNRGNSTRT